MTLTDKKSYTYLLKTAAFVAIAAVLALLPAVVFGKGMLLLSDDFTYQQQIFNIFNIKTWQSGRLFSFSNLIDLGSDTAVSMAFYNLFSPFTIILSLFPSWLSPYLTYPMLVLKYVVAALGASLLTRRFVKDENLAILAGILYSFCGLQTINLLFPFYDETALFPFLILGAELLVSERRPGFFLGFVFLSAITNYYLFFGEVIFVILWFVFRVLLSKSFTGKEKAVSFGLVFIEGLAGTLLAGFILVPVFFSIIQNPRVSNTSFELRFSLKQYLTILQSYFLPADCMGMRNYLFQKGCSSCGLCLPFVSMAFVISYVKDNIKKSSAWFAIACVVISLVPVLNGAFSLFNENYYARWFYMMALLFVVLSCISLDNENQKSLQIGGISNLACTIFTVILEVCAVFLVLSNEKFAKGENINIKLLAVYGAVGIIGSLCLFFTTRIKSKEKMVETIIIGSIIMSILTTSAAAVRYSLGTGTSNQYDKEITNSEGQIGTETSKFLLEGMKELQELIDDDSFYRVRFAYYDEELAYFTNSFDNASMVTGMPSVNSFISTVSGGIFEFYELLGLDRNVATTLGYGDNEFDLACFLSCRYYLSENGYLDNEEAGITLIGKINVSDEKTLYVYKIDSLQMGITYDSYITKDEIEAIDDKYNKLYSIFSSVVLSEEDAKELSNILKNNETKKISSVGELQDRTGTDFSWNDNGFTSTISSDKTQLAFYTVPYSEGFKAYVNGEERKVYDASGMCAVVIDQGENQVVFEYETPGLRTGIILSSIACVLIIFEFIIILIIKKK